MLAFLLLITACFDGGADPSDDGRCSTSLATGDYIECCEDLGYADCEDGLLPSYPSKGCMDHYCYTYTRAGCTGSNMDLANCF
jgi:hypothetical protein